MDTYGANATAPDLAQSRGNALDEFMLETYGDLAQLNFEVLSPDSKELVSRGLPEGTAAATRENGTRVYSLPTRPGYVRGNEFRSWSFDSNGRVVIEANEGFEFDSVIADGAVRMQFTNDVGQIADVAAWARPGETRVIAVPEISGSITFIGPPRQDPLSQFAAGAIRAYATGANDILQAGAFAFQHPIEAGKAVVNAGVVAWHSTANTVRMAMTDSGRAQLGNQISSWANRTGSNIAWHVNNGTIWDGVGQVAGGLALAEMTGGGLVRAGTGGAARQVCFVAGTLIHTRDGLKPIEEVRLGDFVLSRPQQDGDIGERRVVNLVRFDDKPVFEIVVAVAGGRTETFRATGEHPFWVEGEGWVAANGLKPDDRLRLVDGSDACIANVTDTGTTAPVFNFEVDSWHTYHVGALGVWVHNADCFGDILVKNGFARPAGMVNAHGHHIVYKKGFGEVQQQIAADGRAILIRNDIDPIRGVENLAWAPNVKGQHTVENITSVVNDLRAAEALGGTQAEVRARLVEALRRQGELAARR